MFLYVTNSMQTYACVQWYWVGKAEYSLLLVVVRFDVNWGMQQMVMNVCIHLKEDRTSRAQQYLLPFPHFLCCISRRCQSYNYTSIHFVLWQYLINDVEYCPLANNYKPSNSVRLWCYMCTNVSKSDSLLIEVMYRNGSVNCNYWYIILTSLTIQVAIFQGKKILQILSRTSHLDIFQLCNLYSWFILKW